MRRFDGKVVIVTGGGSGIGRASCLAFAAEGARVVVADIVDRDAAETLALLREAGGDGVTQHVDVADSQSVDALVRETAGRYGRLDVYFSNAGVMDAFNNCLATSDDLWAHVIGVNLSGCFYGARAALPELIKTQGNIVMTASIASLGAMAGGLAYTASKHDVIGLVQQLAVEYAPQGVRVNAVLPGGVRTGLSRDLGETPEVDQWVRSMTPLGRWAQPDEIAGAVLYLASEQAGFVTGSSLRVDGGWRSK